MTSISRRSFLAGAGALAAAGTLRGQSAAAASAGAEPLKLKFAVKYGMVRGKASMTEKFALLEKLGFDGVELPSPNNFKRDDVLRARDATGLRIPGVVDSRHWQVRLSSPDAKVRDKARRDLETAIRDVKAFGGSSVLLVPGVVNKETSQQQVWDRSIEQIRRVLPLSAELGIFVLIENVWNRFCYDHDGAGDQTADKLAAYLDAVDSPWVGSYFDIGNHRKYGKPEQWIRTLGKRIVKLDVKDWGGKGGFCKIGDGDVDWVAVRKALREIRYTGWGTAEVAGGNADRLADIKRRMDANLRVAD